MLNYWFISRPKRKLVSVADVLGIAVDVSLNEDWNGQVSTHLSMEEALERKGLKRVGDRRDQGGSGARTYMAWLKSLGLVFKQNSTGKMKLTLAGEALLNGDPPVSVISHQVLRFQYPSAYSIGKRVDISSRFRIHPFWFLLRLLRESKLGYYITQEEIAWIVSTEAENESEECYKKIVQRILQYRESGFSIFSPDFKDTYTSFEGLNDIANTIINWLEYTQLIYREEGKVSVLEEKLEEVDRILSKPLPFIDRPADEEYFQRKYGIDPRHEKDTRNLSSTKSITPAVIAERQIKSAFLSYSVKKPVYSIDAAVVSSISTGTGFSSKVVEEVLQRSFPHGAIGGFMSNYFEMAFKGREDATDFEKATVEIFDRVFGYTSKHIGPIGLTPDVLVIADDDGYQGIIDNKAYSKYSISNDHHNRMVENYIKKIGNYSPSPLPLAFFSYIAGGFSSKIDSQLDRIRQDTGISGSAITVSNVIKMVEKQQQDPYSHTQLREIMGLGRQVLLGDI